MKTITIRDLRHGWPKAEAALKAEGELVVTRDGEPVARLLPITKRETRRKRWDPVEHEARMKRIFGNKLFPSIDDALSKSREDRKL